MIGEVVIGLTRLLTLQVVGGAPYADLLISEGNPVEDINLVASRETCLAMVMKGGVMYKNTLD